MDQQSLFGGGKPPPEGAGRGAISSASDPRQTCVLAPFRAIATLQFI